jgi:hypothetical protein
VLLVLQSSAAQLDDTTSLCLGTAFRDPGCNLTELPPTHLTLLQHHAPPPPNCPFTATMGFTDFFSDVWETFAQPSPDAEAPPQGGASTRSPASGTDEESSEEAEVNKKDAAAKPESQEQGHMPSSKPSDEDEDAAPEEDEEEEEPDPKERLEKGRSTCRIIFGAQPVSNGSQALYGVR